ncbi:hypothetical protein LAZ67_X000772 [Cordylochernes scorpioides]|uniref:Uncharacterized protein n=1 Tax=Cordylochernes scorpioides TaxID=51811 RepID=A0ABY6LSZ7_9ARAC|nr:hypothetical protein LAZ67_X000772 [Cordylochernes scorpioides]
MAFIDNEEINFPFMMSDVWWLRVSFLGDIFDKLNSLNLNLQGAQENIITISTKLKAFKEKLSLWNLNIAKENCIFSDGSRESIKIYYQKEVEETLTLLSASFDKCFPYLDVEKMEWVVNPFMHCEIQHLEEEMQENLIDLKNDLVFKRLFTEKELSEFWLCLNSKFPKLSNAAIESLLPFGSSYLCEQGFSTLTEMKSKKRERLQMIDEEMRLKFVCLLKMTTELLQIQKFNGDNFHLWKFQMKIILEAKDLLSITDGSEVKPEIEDIAKFSEWKKKDAKSKMLITTALEFKYLQQLVNCQTSAEMWKKLSTIYELKSETNKYLLQQRFFENIK